MQTETKKKAQHTPDTWVASGSCVKDESGDLVAVAYASRRFVPDEARLPGESWLAMRDRTAPQRQAVDAEGSRLARLFAAAPDLLAALKLLKEQAHRWSPAYAEDEEWSEVGIIVDNAIAKATGQ